MRLTGWKLPLERLSATSMTSFIACPEAFRRKYLLKEAEAMSGARFMGSVHHEALSKLFDHEFFTHQGGEQGDIGTNAVAAAWQEVLERDGEPEWHDVDATESFQRAKKMIDTYWPIASSAAPVATEQRFEEEIGGVTISGYIDLELPERIREVKTSDKKQSKPKSRHLFQGRLYSLVSQKPVEWHYVTRQATPKVYTPEMDECEALYVDHFNADVTRKMILNMVERMNDFYARYGRDETWPLDGTFGDWTCGYCSYRKSCPAWVAT